MRRIGKSIGWIFCVLAVIAVGWDVAGYARAGTYVSVTPGEVWYAVHPGSLNAAQAGVQRYLLPELWDPGFITILLAPAWLVALVPGLLLLWLCRRQRRSWFH